MMKRILTLILVTVSAGLWAQTQPGSLRGTVTDAENGEPQFQMVVELKDGDEVIQRVSTDFNGNYNIVAIQPGNYSVVVKGGLNYNLSTMGLENAYNAVGDIVENLQTQWQPGIDTGRLLTNHSCP